MEDENILKEATYNQASYLMLRLHELMKRIDLCNINPLSWNYEFNLDNYKVISNDLNSVLWLISSKLTELELKCANKIKDLISDIIQIPIWISISNISLGGIIRYKQLNQKNWDLLKSFLDIFRLELERLMEVHKIGNPSQKDVTKAIIDL